MGTVYRLRDLRRGEQDGNPDADPLADLQLVGQVRVVLTAVTSRRQLSRVRFAIALTPWAHLTGNPLGRSDLRR